MNKLLVILASTESGLKRLAQKVKHLTRGNLDKISSTLSKQ